MFSKSVETVRIDFLLERMWKELYGRICIVKEEKTRRKNDDHIINDRA